VIGGAIVGPERAISSARWGSRSKWAGRGRYRKTILRIDDERIGRNAAEL